MKCELIGGPCDGDVHELDPDRYRYLIVPLPDRRPVLPLRSDAVLNERRAPRHARYRFFGYSLVFDGEYGP